MTVESTARSEAPQTLDQVQTAFSFTFRALVSAPEDIKCIVVTNSTTTLLTYLTDYTVAVSSDGVGGVVNLVDATAVSKGTLTIYRETTNKQESDYDDYNQFPANTLETDLDIRTMVAQETADDITRTLTLPITATGVDATLPIPEAGTVLGWNDAADAIENIVISDLDSTPKASQAQAEAGTNNDTYMTPLRTAQAIAALGGGGGMTTGTFSSATLSTGTLTITHGGGLSAPYICKVVIIDNGGVEILPDSVTGSANSALVDLTSYGTISGTWGYGYLLPV